MCIGFGRVYEGEERKSTSTRKGEKSIYLGYLLRFRNLSEPEEAQCCYKEEAQCARKWDWSNFRLEQVVITPSFASY